MRPVLGLVAKELGRLPVPNEASDKFYREPVLAEALDM